MVFAGYYAQLRHASPSVSNSQGAFRMSSFGAIWPELYLVLDFLHNYQSYSELESKYQLAKISLYLTLPHALSLYQELLTSMMVHPWPTVAEQTAMIGEQHPLLQPLSIFFIVDSSKTSSVDSTDEVTRALHWNDDKGFGPILTIFTTIHGKMIRVEVDFNGNTADVPGFRSSAPFHQTEGCTFPINHTGLGDSIYVGPSSILPGAKYLQNTRQNVAVPPHLQLIHNITLRLKRRIRQGVECAIRVGKRGLGGNDKKMRISMNTVQSRLKLANMIKTAFFHGHALLLMRGQVFMGNPEVLNPTGPDGAVDIATKIINVASGNLKTPATHIAQYFGYLTNGVGQEYPDVFKFPGFP